MAIAMQGPQATVTAQTFSQLGLYVMVLGRQTGVTLAPSIQQHWGELFVDHRINWVFSPVLHYYISVDFVWGHIWLCSWLTPGIPSSISQGPYMVPGIEPLSDAHKNLTSELAVWLYIKNFYNSCIFVRDLRVKKLGGILFLNNKTDLEP